MIVVDTNILVYLFLPTSQTPMAEALLRKDSDWVAPMLWRSEFRNVLAGYMRRKALSFDEACVLQAEAEHFMASAEHDVKSQEVLELARSSDCSAYDCEYAALAMQLGVKLVTMDGKLLKAFPKHTLSLSDTRAEHGR